MRLKHIALPEDDEVSVAEINDLMNEVNKFYIDRKYSGPNIIWLSNLVLKRLMNDRDFFANVEGVRGMGKSNFILLLCLIQCRYSGIWRNKKDGRLVKVLPRLKPLPAEWEHVKFGFSFKNNMSFLDDSKLVKSKFHGLDRYHPFILDEGSKNLHKYEWNSRLQLLLVKMSDTERYQNKATYVCLPNFKELNPSFRNDRIMLRVYIYDRHLSAGYSSCIISLKDINRFVTDPWHTDENAKLFEFLLKRKPAALRTPKDILYAEKKLAGFAGDFDIPSLEKIAPRIWNIYMTYKIHNAQKDAEENPVDEEAEASIRVKKWKNYTRRLIDYAKQLDPNVRNEQIYLAMGVTKGTYMKLISETSDLEYIQPQLS